MSPPGLSFFCFCVFLSIFFSVGHSFFLFVFSFLFFFSFCLFSFLCPSLLFFSCIHYKNKKIHQFVQIFFNLFMSDDTYFAKFVVSKKFFPDPKKSISKKDLPHLFEDIVRGFENIFSCQRKCSILASL